MFRYSPTAIPAALWALIILQVVMVSSLYAGVPPHPPRSVALFALAPFLAASIACAAAALQMGRHGGGDILAVGAALMALLSFGPQKYFDPAFPEIWPAVLAAQLAVLTIMANLFFKRTSAKAAQE